MLLLLTAILLEQRREKTQGNIAENKDQETTGVDKGVARDVSNISPDVSDLMIWIRVAFEPKWGNFIVFPSGSHLVRSRRYLLIYVKHVVAVICM